MKHTAKGKIKILMTLGNTGRGGAQSYVVNILRNIDTSRYQVDFAVSFIHKNGYEKEMEQYGCKIHIVPKFKVINYRKYKQAWTAILAQGKYDIVHGHVSSTAGIYLKEAKKFGCATIAHSHSAGYRGSAFERIVKKLFTVGAKKYADYWFACAEPAAIRMFGNRYRENPNFYELPNAIDTSRYLFNQNVRERLRAELQIEKDAVLYGHVGTFSTPKNHEFLIDVFEQIYKEQGDKAHLVLVGEGALRAQIEQKVAKLGLQKQVVFTGIVDNAQEYLMAMDTLIFPSLFEGVPLVLIEAQAAGLYCVVSDNVTKAVNLTQCIVSLPLEKGAEHWARAAQEIPNIARVEMNRIIAETKYNMCNSIGTLTSLYEKMSRP